MFQWLRPLLFVLPPETAHRLVQGLLVGVQKPSLHRLLGRIFRPPSSRLRTRLFGLEFPGPVGVAAGFDKNGRVYPALASLGFGHVEVGAVTPRPQAGNPRPRLFRLPEDRALINRMGFNNEGARTVARRMVEHPPCPVPVGVNLGKMKETPLDEAARDYVEVYRRLRDAGDYFVVNVSSPNTPDLRRLQAAERLTGILRALRAEGARPLLLKLSPDLSRDALDDVLEIVHDYELEGLIATNTTVARPDTLRSSHRSEEGGLSGRPIASRSTRIVRYLASRTDVPIVGVGGVFSAEDAYRKIKAGASLVQLYTGLVYRGPSVARDINRGVLERLERDGFHGIGDAVGEGLSPTDGTP